jgi:putative membrane protein
MSAAPRGARETQPARTALAWQRTGLGLLLVAGLLARLAAVHGAAALAVATVIVAGAGLAVLGVLTPHRRRTTQLAAITGGPGHAPRAAALGTGLVVLAAVCGLAADLVVQLG